MKYQVSLQKLPRDSVQDFLPVPSRLQVLKNKIQWETKKMLTTCGTLVVRYPEARD